VTSLAGTRCAVLGGGGFLGTHLCRALAAADTDVRAFGRRMRFPEAMPPVDWIPGDFADTSTVAAAIEGCAVVFHLVSAATPASANVDTAADLRAHVAPTLDLLDACRAAGVARVVFVSSGGTVYGVPAQVPIPETAPTDPITAYGVQKLAIEKYLHVYAHLHGLDYRILRVANAYGPYQTATKNQGAVGAFARAALAGRPIEIWGDGEVVRDYVHAEDVAQACRLAAAHDGPKKLFNVGTGTGTSLNHLVAALERQLGTGLDIRRRPGRALDVPRNVLDITRATGELGWQPANDLDRGLARTLAWLRAR
jgi:UDP-glucose 4-epimerase